MNIWLHRISHEREASYPLLDKDFISIGWSDFTSKDFLVEQQLGSAQEYLEKVRSNEGRQFFEKYLTEHWGELKRSRYSLWRFITQMKPGDLVLIPQYKTFSVYEILKEAFPVTDLKLPQNLQTCNKEPIVFKDGLLTTEKREDPFDLGFIIPVKAVERDIPRSDYADAALTARMKILDTNAEISDLRENINNAINCFRQKKPLNLYSEIVDNTRTSVLNQIKKISNPDKLEQLIKWYCWKAGASSVNIPSKNAPKEGDADIIATFESLKLILYVQAKFHNDTTGDWAVQQINEYKCQFDEYDGYSRVAWVITTAKKYSDDAITKAQENNINLINGEQFAEMLINVGFAGLDI